ncbi:Pumilio-like 5, partial [Glycine soja]
QHGSHFLQHKLESCGVKEKELVFKEFFEYGSPEQRKELANRLLVLQHCSDEIQCHFIVDQILESVFTLAQDQYGNYVTQHVLERGKPQERSQIIHKLSRHIVQLTQHKFASNVVEKCLEYGDAIDNDERPISNYVIPKVLEICSENQRATLLSRITLNVDALKNTYGKHIVAQFEELVGECV